MNLNGNNLPGTIPPEIGSLAMLNLLNLASKSRHWINELNSTLNISIENNDNVFEIESGDLIDVDYKITIWAKEE